MPRLVIFPLSSRSLSFSSISFRSAQGPAHRLGPPLRDGIADHGRPAQQERSLAIPLMAQLLLARTAMLLIERPGASGGPAY